MGLFIVFITILAYFISIYSGLGEGAIVIAFLFSTLASVGSYFFSDKIVLGLSGARELQNSAGRDVYDLVQNISIASGLPMPKVYVVDDPSPNAFATGRDPKHATVCFTTGILRMLSKSELEGVVAHELSHVKNYDTLLMVIVAVLVGMVSILGDWFMRSLWWGRGGNDREEKGNNGILMVIGLIFIILSPIIATLIQLAISRRREFLADASAALVTRYPAGLADALEKLSAYKGGMHNATSATAHLFIVNPFKDKDATSWLTGLFSTHPPIEERIKILRNM